MKRVTCISIVVLFFFSLSTAYGQDVAGETVRNATSAADSTCTPLSEMALTEEQNRAIEMVSASYRTELLQLRSNLMAKRIEFRGLMKDPEANTEKIHAAADDIEMLRSRFDDMVLEYQMEIRKNLTPDQIKSWCINEEMAVKREKK